MHGWAMEGLAFEAEPFVLGESGQGCSCAQCSARGRSSSGELEWEVAADRRPRAASCKTQMPAEVESCRKQAATKAILCRPGSGVTCPEIPELWKSRRVAGVPFYYGAQVAPIKGTQKYQLVRVQQQERAQEFTPKAWWSLWTWVTQMNTFGMPIAAIVTAGARYCRCVKRPKGACGEKTPGGCTGTNLSNHGYGDAVDVVGVYWKDPAAVGSSLPATVVHSWADRGDQGQLLRRINGALRASFATVYDYAREDHRDHFHCDTNRGRGRPNWWQGNGYTDPCEPFFLLGSLAWLGYVDAVKPVTWQRARAGLSLFAQRAGMPAPASDRPQAWEAVATRLFACVALGAPAGCKRA